MIVLWTILGFIIIMTGLEVVDRYLSPDLYDDSDDEED